MQKTRRSLYYLAGYLVPTGIALLLAPASTLKLLLSNQNYGDVMPRLVGMFMLALGIVVIQMIRYNLNVLYPTTLVLRLCMIPVLLGLFFHSQDPVFITFLIVMGIGVVFTGASYFLDIKQK